MFKLVLTDIQMPEMDGYEVAAQIIALQRGWRERIIQEQTLGKRKL
jgi:CheY-like chemotaxis protein